MPYPTSNITKTEPFAECNANCGCSLDKYQPVCNGDILYFSPCYAGCDVQYNETVGCVAYNWQAPDRNINTNALSF